MHAGCCMPSVGPQPAPQPSLGARPRGQQPAADRQPAAPSSPSTHATHVLRLQDGTPPITTGATSRWRSSCHCTGKCQLRAQPKGFQPFDRSGGPPPLLPALWLARRKRQRRPRVELTCRRPARAGLLRGCAAAVLPIPTSPLLAPLEREPHHPDPRAVLRRMPWVFTYNDWSGGTEYDMMVKVGRQVLLVRPSARCIHSLRRASQPRLLARRQQHSQHSWGRGGGIVGWTRWGR